MRHPERHLFHATPDTLAEWFEREGSPRYRAKQTLEWLYRKGVDDPAHMTDLPARDQEALAASWTTRSGRTLRHERATDGVQKLLVEWADPDASGVSLPLAGDPGDPGDPARQTECVMIPAPTTEARDRKTACISSQVGCPVGCRFCASGLGGLDGNLSAGRIVEQVWSLSRLPDVERITNVVFMGMGEPLANFAAVLHAVRTIAAPWGLGIGARKITISTVGLPAAIERLARELELPVTLALSLHAPNDDLRRELIPWSEHTTIDELTDACAVWFDKTGREITLEYILLGGVNDGTDHARELAHVTKHLRANVNLIRYNEVHGLPYQRPANERVRRFQTELRDRGVNAHIRASRGRDIAAACGQLRHESAGAPPELTQPTPATTTRGSPSRSRSTRTSEYPSTPDAIASASSALDAAISTATNPPGRTSAGAPRRMGSTNRRPSSPPRRAPSGSKSRTFRATSPHSRSGTYGGFATK